MTRTVLVTGGSSGIGLAVAKAFLNEGASVTVTGRTKAELAGLPDGMMCRTLDLRYPDKIQQVTCEFNELDILVNCAGMILRDQKEHTAEGFAEVLQVNLAGTMNMSIALKDALAARGGCVVNIASMLSYFGSGLVPGYSASKGGIVQLTKSLAIAWATDGIRVNAVAPGWIETELTAPLRSQRSRSDEILQRTPMGRWGHPDEIAGPVMFLCSEQAKFVTGAVLPVDGGYSAM